MGQAQGHITVRRRPKDGAAGDDAFRLDLNNENDSLLYDAEGNLLSGSVVTVATLYKGGVAVGSGVTYAISERSGCTASQATISGNTVTVSGISSTGYVMVSATYNNNTYYAKFSLKRIVGDVKYDLLVTPDAIAYNSTTGTKSASTINVKIFRTAQNNSSGVTRAVMSSTPSGYTLKVDGTTVSYTSSSGYTFNVDTTKSSHVVSLYYGTTLVDEETVPINKSADGAAGDPGSPGSPGSNGKTTMTYFKWGTSKPSKPTATSLTDSVGTIPAPSGWSTQCEDRIVFSNPNSDSYRDWSDVGEGVRKLSANGTTDNLLQGELIQVVLPAGGKIDVRASILGEANYDFVYVSPLFTTKSAVVTSLATFLANCYRYSAISTNGYDVTRAVPGSGYTTVNTETITAQNSTGSLGTFFLYVAYRKDGSDSSSPEGWDGGYASYVPSVTGDVLRYAVSGTGEMTFTTTQTTFSDITWGEIFTYANDGPTGLEHRCSAWQANVEYRNDTGRSGEPRYIDICFNRQISLIGDSSFAAYKCIRTHISGDIELGDSNYWEPINSLQPIVAAFILANKITADYIDVNTLVADSTFINSLVAQSAFIDELVVKRLETIDSNGKGVKIEGNELTAYDSSGNACVNITGDSIGDVGGSSSSTNIAAQTLSGTQNNIGPQTSSGGATELYHRQTSNLSGSAKSLGTLASGAVVTIPSHTLTFKLKSNTSNVNNTVADGYFTVSIYKDSTLIASAPQMGVSLRGYGSNVERSETITMPQVSFSASGATSITYKVKFVSEMETAQTLTYTVSVPAITVTTAVANQQTIMGSDGFRVQLTPTAYFEAKISSNTARVTMISGSYGLRITSSGIQKTTDGGSTWSAASL